MCLGQRNPSLWKGLRRQAALGKAWKEPEGLGLNHSIVERIRNASGLLAGASRAGGEGEMLPFPAEVACPCPKACPQGLAQNTNAVCRVLPTYRTLMLISLKLPSNYIVPLHFKH